jgi:lanosterol synthase
MVRKKVKATAVDTEPLLEKGSTRKRLSNAGDLDHATKRARIEERTDYSRWRMRDDEGRQTWHYLEDDEAVKKWPQTSADKYFLGLPLVSVLVHLLCCIPSITNQPGPTGSPRASEGR